MRSRVPAVLLLLLCVLTGAGRHTDEGAQAVAAAQPPAERQIPAIGQTPYDAVLPTLHAAKGTQTVGGVAALLPAGSWPVRRAAAEPIEAAGVILAGTAGHAVAPARAPPGPSTR